MELYKLSKSLKVMASLEVSAPPLLDVSALVFKLATEAVRSSTYIFLGDHFGDSKPFYLTAVWFLEDF